MPISDPKLYSDGQLGAGTVATLENYAINAETAGADIRFGQAVIMKGGKVVPATKAPIYGIALKRGWTSSEDFIQTEMDQDHYSEGNALDVMRDGSIAVPLSGDVNRGENATVDSDGNFKAAGTSDEVVGVFLSDGQKDGTATVQTRIQFGHGNADDDSGAGSSSSSSNSSSSSSSKSTSNSGSGK